MKKYKFSSAFCLSFVLMLFLSFTAFANSSWVWLTVKPYDVLPFGALLTLIIESAAIFYFTKQSNIYKVITGVFIGNLLSFALTYVGYGFSGTPYGLSDLKMILNHFPFYTVGAVFLILTLAIETPFVYFFLRKDTQSKKKLIITTLLSNVVTTALVALIERTLCHGHW